MKTFKIKDKEYILKKIRHKKGNDKLELIPFNREEYDKVIKEITDKVKHSINAEELIKATLSNLEYENILEIRNAIRRKAKIRASRGCYEILIGKNKYIPLIS